MRAVAIYCVPRENKRDSLPSIPLVDLTMDCDLYTSIPEWVIEHPETSAVFAAFGLDTSCGGKSLEYLCHHQGLSPPAVLERLHQVIAKLQDD